MGELMLAGLLNHDDVAADQQVLSGDAVTLAVLEIDGHCIAFTWFSDSGTDRASGEIDGGPLGVVEKLDSTSPRMLPDEVWKAWLSQDDREQRIISAVQRQWEPRPLFLGRTGESRDQS
jgi:hypothetical protein